MSIDVETEQKATCDGCGRVANVKIRVPEEIADYVGRKIADAVKSLRVEYRKCLGHYPGQNGIWCGDSRGEDDFDQVLDAFINSMHGVEPKP